MSKSLNNIITNNANTFITISLITPTKKTGILNNLTFSLKDNFVVKDILTTAGSKILYNYYPTYSCTVFELLHNESAIFVGKNSLDEFGAGSGANSLKPIINLHNPSNSTGGSSSGSASAVFGDEVGFAICSDTGGSVRHPAHHCKVIGFKPSQRQISRYGLIAMADPLDCVSILSKDIKIIKKVYSVLNQLDKKDNMNSPLLLNSEIKEYVLLNEYSLFTQTLLSKLFKVKTLSYDFSNIDQQYKQIMFPYFYSSLNRYDGIKFNNFKFNVAYSSKTVIQNRTELLSAEVKYRIYAGFIQTPLFKNVVKQTYEFTSSQIYFIELNSIKTSPATYSRDLEFANIHDLCAILIPLTNEISLQILSVPGNQHTVLNVADQILANNNDS